MRSHLLPLALVALAAFLDLGCDGTSRPNRPPAPFAADGLDGKRWDNDALRGRPWIVNVWMPG